MPRWPMGLPLGSCLREPRIMVSRLRIDMRSGRAAVSKALPQEGHRDTGRRRVWYDGRFSAAVGVRFKC
jgi:hypothetical protein